jgi:hypothetical protein
MHLCRWQWLIETAQQNTQPCVYSGGKRHSVTLHVKNFTEYTLHKISTKGPKQTPPLSVTEGPGEEKGKLMGPAGALHYFKPKNCRSEEPTKSSSKLFFSPGNVFHLAFSAQPLLPPLLAVESAIAA